VRVALAVLVLALAPYVCAAAEQSLFASHEPLVLTVEGPWRHVQRAKDGESGGVLYLSRPKADPLSVRISPRGHSRLEFCRFPPLRVEFDREEVAQTVFAGQHRLKLVTQCTPQRASGDQLRLEYFVYRVLNLLSPRTFRVRIADITYVDSEGKRRDVVQPGFFIEDDARMAERLGLERVVVKRLDPRDIDQHYLGLVTLFQFMIGNTDWSFVSGLRGSDCCHNGELLGKPGLETARIVVPYDFDQAGLIDVDYAAPYPALGISDVKQRLSRGFCSTSEYLGGIVGEFEEKRDAIFELLDALEIGASVKRKASRYIEGFYDIIGDPKDVDRYILRKCRGRAAAEEHS
jgi:hypothetical protein